jgi:hypothetical protein
MVLLATPGFISMREKCRLLPQVLPNAKLRQIAQIKNLTELLNYLAPREWVRTIDRTGNNPVIGGSCCNHAKRVEQHNPQLTSQM